MQTSSTVQLHSSRQFSRRVSDRRGSSSGYDSAADQSHGNSSSLEWLRGVEASLDQGLEQFHQSTPLSDDRKVRTPAHSSSFLTTEDEWTDDDEANNSHIDLLQRELALAESGYRILPSLSGEAEGEEADHEEEEETNVSALKPKSSSSTNRIQRRWNQRKLHDLQEEKDDDEEEVDDDLRILEELRRDWLAQRASAMEDLLELSESEESTDAEDSDDDESSVVVIRKVQKYQSATGTKSLSLGWLTALSIAICVFILLIGGLLMSATKMRNATPSGSFSSISNDTPAITTMTAELLVASPSLVLAQQESVVASTVAKTSSASPLCQQPRRRRIRRNTRMLVVDRKYRAQQAACGSL